MSNSVDAVIAALRVALAEAERSRETHWEANKANRFIAQLPGAWMGRWRNLRVKTDLGLLERTDFVAQLRATLAYLEANRDHVSSASWFTRSKLKRVQPSGPIDAEFREVPRNVHPLPVPPPNKRNR